MLERDYLRRGVAEFVGTFALIFIACGGAAYARTATDLALANGLAIAVMVSAVAFISGGFFNPAVTLGFLITRRISPLLAVWYWIDAVRRRGARSAARRLGAAGRPGEREQPRRARPRLGDRLRRRRRRRGSDHVLPASG